ncbi:hypothetical protein KM914_00775 [Virgibacillus pantothenticus]|nr:hypothetical protein [Virgibacillus pantothenticus]MBU8564983.1 hypothetical protein [Virgibacillus pantothenticus]
MLKPPITFQMDQKVKRAMERGREPQLVKKEHLPSTSIRAKPRTKRPW